MIDPNIQLMVEDIAASIVDYQPRRKNCEYLFTDVDGINGNDWNVVYSYNFNHGAIVTEDDYFDGTGYSYFPEATVAVEIDRIEYCFGDEDDWHVWDGDYRLIEKEIEETVLALCE